MKTAILIALLAVTACGPSLQTKAPHRSQNLITEEEFKTTSAHNAYDAIKTLRPRMLRRRGDLPSVVYMNGARMGEIGLLYNINAETIKEVRYLSASEATVQYGTGHTGGAILITTK